VVYIRELRLAVCTSEEVEESISEDKEAGTMFRALIEYLMRLAEGA